MRRLRGALQAVAAVLATALLLVACEPERQPRPLATLPPVPARATSPLAVAAPTPTAAVARGQPSPLPAGDSPAVAVYRQNGASVVNITSIAVVRSLRGGTTQQPQGIGSGFMVDAEGRIVTNNHVVRDADQLTVTFQDKTTVPARLLGRDPDNDLAVIQVDPNATDDEGRPVRERIAPVRLGDSSQVTIGEVAIAIGSPLGLQQTVTQGIVSALRNPGEEAARGTLDLLGGAIQTDASINPGNSGGPLFNARGEVIGVNSAILSQSGGNEGIGFAIPANVVKRVVPELIASGRYAHPLLGITSLPLAQLGQQTKQQLGLPQKGLLVQESSAGAARAGIRGGNRAATIDGEQILLGGDIVVAIDGQAVSTGGELRGYIENNKHPGDSVTVTIVRDGQRLDVVATLTERPTTQR